MAKITCSMPRHGHIRMEYDMKPPQQQSDVVYFPGDGGFGFDQAGWYRLLISVETLWADDVVVAQINSFIDETLATFVAREAAAVPVSTFERHILSVFLSEACMQHASHHPTFTLAP